MNCTKLCVVVAFICCCLIVAGQNHKQVTDDRLIYYYDSIGKNINFTTVTMYTYSSKDSTLKNKRIDKKSITRFNLLGKKVMEVTIDTDGYATDSAIYVYDPKGHKIRETRYGTEYGHGDFHMVLDSIRTYDNKGNIIEDSIWRRENCIPVCSSHTEFKYKYDSANNKTWEMKAEDGELIFHIYAYNNGKLQCEKKIITRNEKNEVEPGHFTPGYYYTGTIIVTKDTTQKEFYIYNEYGNVIMDSNIEINDTDILKRQYHKGKLLTEEHYNNGELINSKTITFSKDSGHTETDYVYNYDKYQKNRPFKDIFVSAPSESCSDERKTITVYDKNNNRLSCIAYHTMGDVSDTSMVTNKYTFSHGKIVCDSEFTDERAYLYFSRSIRIHTCKYNSTSRLVDEEETGGGMYNGHSKHEWTFNGHDKLVSEVLYGTCPYPPEKMTINLYYPDGVTVKLNSEQEGSYSTYLRYYDMNGRLNEFRAKYAKGSLEQVIYEYTR
jgi:hypothetical protein